MSKKIKLVLSGSGTKFPVFIGGIRRLEEEGYQVEAVAGTSGGAIVAAGMASGKISSYQMEGLVRELMPQIPKLVKPSIWSLIRNFGFFRTSKLRQVFSKHLVSQMGDTVIPCKIITANVDATGYQDSAVVWDSRKDSGKSLPLVTAASMSIPFVFEQVLIDDDQHVDGGLLKNFAIDSFPDSENVIGLTFSGKLASNKEIPWYKPISRLVNRFLRLMDLVMIQNVREDIEDAKGAAVIPVSTSVDGLDFKITDDKISLMITDGYNAVSDYIQNNPGKLP
jgi:predicted acylesterase/phospholipase RssA